MKNTGLKNRFNREELAEMYCFNFKCFWCEKNGADCFHHIKSSGGSADYVAGSHNSSLFNAIPLHNHICHLYNPELHKPEVEKKLLKKTLAYLQKQDYLITEKDKVFLSVYEKNYN